MGAFINNVYGDDFQIKVYTLSTCTRYYTPGANWCPETFQHMECYFQGRFWVFEYAFLESALSEDGTHYST